jgi:hypothetical protein
MKSLFDYGREVFSQQQALQIGKTGNFGLFRPVAKHPHIPSETGLLIPSDCVRCYAESGLHYFLRGSAWDCG